MPRPSIDYTGLRFGRLVVTSFSHRIKGESFYSCLCDCGNTSVVRRTNLRVKHTMSCGCLEKEIKLVAKLIHGEHSKGKMSVEYRIWHHIKSRCANPNEKAYHHYGGRGIKMCDEWLNDPAKFISDMGRRPNDKLSIDRIDNNGNYCKENCRWATKAEQNSNTRRNVFLTHNGKTMTIKQWESELGTKINLIQSRIRAGWSTERALTEPANAYKDAIFQTH